MRTIRAIAFVLPLAGAALASGGAASGPDVGVKDASSAFWLKHGAVYNLPLMDAEGRLRLQQTKYYLATESLIAGHATDARGRHYAHAHFKDDYKDLAGANRFWDARFDAPASTVRVGDATTEGNGFNLVLTTFLRQGTYPYWIDNNLDAAPSALKVDLAALSGALPPAGKAQDPPGAAPSQGQASGPGTAAFEVGETSWKHGPSGVYRNKRERAGNQPISAVVERPR